VFIALKQWHWQYQSSSIKTRRVLSTFFTGCQTAKEGKLELEKQEYEMALLHVIDNALAQESL